MANHIDKETNSGTKYRVSKVPQDVVYKVDSLTDSGEQDGENEYYTAYIDTNEVKKTLFPLNANPRKPNSIGGDESKDIVVKMQTTLSSNPTSFVRLNNGLTCVCTGMKYDPASKSLTVNWKGGDGVLNGGHTYLAIQTADDAKARVRVEIVKLNSKYSKDENAEARKELIKEMAMARNANRQLKANTRAEYEGKHELFQDYLDDLRGVIDWSEGYEEMSTTPFDFAKNIKVALTPEAFVRYLALLDKAWCWHPAETESDIYTTPTKNTVLGVGEMLVKGAATYTDWGVVALISHNEKNLVSIAPLSRMLLKLLDTIRLSMKYKKDTLGKTTNPIGCGTNFSVSDFFTNSAGATQGKGRTYYDKGAEKVPKSAPHFLGYMINFMRPFVWQGDVDEEDKALIGWHYSPVDAYGELSKDISKDMMGKFKAFDTARDFYKDGVHGMDVWESHVKELWGKKCSIDSSEDEFFPLVFFDPDAEKWYTKDEVNPTNILAFDKSDKTWRVVAVGTGVGDDEVSRNYKEISRPY
jgi:hypothetical protein